MAKSERRVDIDSEIWNKILSHLPNANLNHVVGELLFQLANTFHDEQFHLTPFFKEAAQRAKESLEE